MRIETVKFGDIDSPSPSLLEAIYQAIFDARSHSLGRLFDAPTTRRLIERFWHMEGSEIHHSNAEMLLVDGALGALVVMVPLEKLKQARQKDFYKMLSVAPDKKAFMAALKDYDAMFAPIHEAQGYYNSIFTAPKAMRGQKYGLSLLQQWIEKVKKEKLLLLFDIHHQSQRLIRTHQANGFRITDDTHEYYRMEMDARQ